jgi:hypothetical protein
VPERLVREPTRDRSPTRRLGATPVALRIGLHEPALNHRPIGFQPPPHGNETELVKAAERRQVRVSEGSVNHVQVLQVGCVRTPISGGTSTNVRLPRCYTLICDEPETLDLSRHLTMRTARTLYSHVVTYYFRK